MPDRPFRKLIAHVHSLSQVPRPEIADAELVARFIDQADELAFEVLVRRHGAMVLRVCRRLLRDSHDAEDAFQATFLLLLRKARSIGKQGSVASWLYKVAYRVALRAQQRSARRLAPLNEEPPAPGEEAEAAWRDLRPVLDQELNRLPEKYRTVTVLCYLEGKSHERVADEIGCKTGAVTMRLKRARDLLHERLTRRGLVLSTGLFTALLTRTAEGAVPAALVSATVRHALIDGAAPAAGAAIIPERISTLVEGVMKAMLVTRLKIAAGVVCILAALGLGTGLWLQEALAAPDTEPTLAVADSPAPQPPEVKKDAYGDPLPPGAIARLGTSRLRHFGLRGQYYDPGTIAFLPDGKTLFSAGCWSFRFWDAATGQKIGGFDLEKPALPQQNTLAACALAPDGKTLAMTMRYEGTIRLVDAATAKEIRRFEGHPRGNGTRSVTRIDFSADGKMLASVATDGTLRLWEVASGKEIRKLSGWDAVKQIPVGLLGDIHPWVKFSPDGKMLVSKDGGNVRLWEVASGKEIRRLLDVRAAGGIGLVPQGNPQGQGGMPANGPAPGVPRNAAFSPDGKIVAVGFGSGVEVGYPNPDHLSKASVCLWETLTGKLIREIVVKAEVRAVAFSPDGKTLAAAISDYRKPDYLIHLYDWTTGKKIGELVGHSRDVCSLAFAPDGKTLASAARDGTIRLWDPATGKDLRPDDGNQASAGTIAVSPDGKTVATAGLDNNTIVLWEATTGKVIRRIAAPPPAKPDALPRFALYKERVWSLAFSPDGKMLASGSGDTSIYLWNPATGQQIRRLDGHKHWVRSVAFSADGKLLASGSEDKTVALWDPATGQRLRQLAGHDHGVRSVALSRDGKVLASGSEHLVLLWDPATGKPIPHQAGKLAFDAISMAFSPDGKYVAVGGGHGSFETHVIELATGKEIGRCPHKDGIWSVAFSPDGKMVASVGHDHKVFVLDVATGKLIHGFDPQQGPLFAVAFSPDSKTLFSGGEDTTVLLWDVDHLRRAGEQAEPADKPKDEKPAKPAPQEPAKPEAKELADQPGQEPAGQTDKSTDQEASDPAEKKPADEAAQEPSTSGDKKSTRRADKEADSPVAKELEALWIALASEDAGKAYEAITALAKAPKEAVPFLQERLLVPPPPPPDPQRLSQLIADLASTTFAVRQKATEELEKVAKAAEAALGKALAQNPSLEVRRRLERLLERLKTPSGDELRQVRAIQALEYAGTPEAKRVLETLARRADGAPATREAQGSVERLLKQTPSAAPAR
jgi:RNA polymerase sigma factor (sigma-70 family)